MSPFPVSFHVAHSAGPPMLGSLAIEGIMCWEGKELFPQILFLILLPLGRVSKSVTLLLP